MAEIQAQAKDTYNENAQPTNDSSFERLTWTIKSFSTCGNKKLYSEVFCAGGYKWRILIYPKGNKVDYVSVYLDVADSSTLPHDWSKHAHFSLSIISQNHEYTMKKEAEHEFNAKESDWGFTSFLPLTELEDPIRGYLVRGECTVQAEVWFDEQGNTVKRNEKAESDDCFKNTVPPQDPTVIETGKSSSSFAEFDTLFADIRNLVEGETFKLENFSNFHSPKWRSEEIANAKVVFKECLDIDLAKVIESGRDFELKKSLSVLLSTNEFPDNMVDEITHFLANFDKTSEQYEVAQQDLIEVQEKEKLIGQLKSTMKQLSSKFMPIRNLAEAVDSEIVGLESQLTEKNVMKARLTKRLKVLASQATTSKQALINAEQDMKLLTLKKEEAEKLIADVDRSWESLKAGRSLLL
ncbi:E3 ubiquitin-protein ligase SIN-like [Parasponia andersonii]|uniref:E3 ubiquitin-protein ligase SIN-like n=1 Tax=Parasponia andersonii TaxID=3476 RepID=A0A2P5C128_PARAD|nr:E3 ubiquitin-protein ligase SIN-like [Parasponia andersonii]